MARHNREEQDRFLVAPARPPKRLLQSDGDASSAPCARPLASTSKEPHARLSMVPMDELGLSTGFGFSRFLCPPGKRVRPTRLWHPQKMKISGQAFSGRVLNLLCFFPSPSDPPPAPIGIWFQKDVRARMSLVFSLIPMGAGGESEGLGEKQSRLLLRRVH